MAGEAAVDLREGREMEREIGRRGEKREEMIEKRGEEESRLVIATERKFQGSQDEWRGE